MNKTFQMPIIVSAVRTTADKGLEIKIRTRDVKTFKEGQVDTIMKMLDKEYWAAFKEQPIEAEDISVGKERLETGQKSPAQRLRAVLYVLWEASKSSTDFESYYREKIEKFIDRVKENLE